MAGSEDRRRRVLAVVLVPFTIVLFMAYVWWANPPMARQSVQDVVLSPDGTRFAYALDYHYYRGWLIDFHPASAGVEIWTYDLSRKKGPRRVGGWRHDARVDARLVGWTADGLYLSYDSNTSSYRDDATCELVDPKSGSRFSDGPPPPHGAYPPDPSRPEDRRRPHVEVRNDEFFQWDPASLKLVPLFALPIDRNGWDPRGVDLTKRRATALRQDGFQEIDRVEASKESNGLLVRVSSFARRTAPFARRYRLHFEAPTYVEGKLPNETDQVYRAVWDTLVTPNPAGDALTVLVPYTRFWKAIQPERELMRGYGSDYDCNLITTLVPDSLPGDEGVAPGIRDGGARSNWTEVHIPLP